MKESKEELVKIVKEKAKEAKLMPTSEEEDKQLIRFFQLHKFASIMYNSKKNMKLRTLRRILLKNFKKQNITLEEVWYIVPKNYEPIPLDLKQ